MTFPFETVTAIGDHGSITFRKSDGVVVARDFDSGYEDDPDAGYPLILRANPNTLTNDPMDILHVGSYFQMPKTEVCYEPPIDMEEDLAPPLPKTEPKSMKPFDLEQAKAGAPVITRNGRKARIICFDVKNDTYPMLALVTNSSGVEFPKTYTREGKYYATVNAGAVDAKSPYDLFMGPVKREGWVNLYQNAIAQSGVAVYTVYLTEEQAKLNISKTGIFIATAKITWEE